MSLKIRFAVTPPTEVLTDEFKFGAYLQACEELGFDTLWLSDLPLGMSGDPVLSLAFAAASTLRIKLGVNIVPLGRNPFWLAKQLAHLDRLSRGRLLLSFVPGIGAPQERRALGYTTGDRGAAIEQTITLLRRWWCGERVTASFAGFDFADVSVSPRPLQDPLEIWLGGVGPQALDRVSRIADGWLTANATPKEAADGVATILRDAYEHGRSIDPEHFGISIPFSRAQPSAESLHALRSRRKDGDLTQIVPVGRLEVRQLIGAHIDAGLSKFVLRSTASGANVFDELKWLADTVLDSQN